MRRDAEEYERRERTKAALPELQRPPITLDEACGLYGEKVIDGPSWATIRYMLAALTQSLGAHLTLRDITQRDLQRFFQGRKEGRANETINREIDNARAVWRYAEANRFDVGDMPNWRIMKLRAPRRPPRELSADEEQSLMPSLRDDVRDAVDFMLKSGWRRSEVLDLRWSDCDFANGCAVTKIKGGDTVKRPLTSSLVAIIKRQPKVCPQVFTYVCQKTKSALTDQNGVKRPARLKGERYPLTATSLRKPFANAKKEADIECFRLHDLRHTRATRIVRSTGNLAVAKEALKHRSIATTLRYAHVLDDDVRNALEESDSHNSPAAYSGSDKKISRL